MADSEAKEKAEKLVFGRPQRSETWADLYLAVIDKVK